MRSSEDILVGLLSEAETLAPYLFWTPKTPQSDILSIVTSEFSREYILLEYVKLVSRLTGYERLEIDTDLRTKLKNILNITEEELIKLLQSDLEEYSGIWNLTRRAATYAKGAVKLIFSVSDVVTIPDGTVFKNLTNNRRYQLLDMISFVAPTLIGGFHQISVILECLESGPKGNIVSGTNFVSETNIANLSQVYNTSTWSNGSERENNTDYVARIRIARASRGVGSRSFVKNLMLEDPRVIEVLLKSKGEDGFNRPFGLDVWVYAMETTKEYSDTITNTTHVFRYAPLTEDESYRTSDQFVEDPGTYSRSVMSYDRSENLGIGDTISYHVDQTIQDLQTKIDDTENWILGGRSMCLVKKAKGIRIDIGTSDQSVDIYCSFGYDPDTVKTEIESNLVIFFSGGLTSYGQRFDRKLLDVNIDVSDVLNIILDTEGVDRVDPLTFTCYRTDDPTIIAGQLIIDFNEYAILGTRYLNVM